jgi:cyclopropane fatty-acyl-phospholipid synthase-like methyltransferase
MSVSPTSFWSSLPKICSEFEYGNYTKVLDIGLGSGKYGLLCREYSKNLEQLDGVEVHKPYITDVQKAIYDTIYYMDVTKDYTKLPTDYDLVLMIDVIEHMSYEKGHEILKYFKGSSILVSTPISFATEPHPENPFQEHITHWTHDNFSRYNYVNMSEGPALIILISPE